MLNKKNNKGKGKGFMPKFNFYWIYGIVAVILILMNVPNLLNSGLKSTTYPQFKSFLEKNQVKNVEYNDTKAFVYIYSDKLNQEPHAKHNFDKDLSNTKYGILINWPGAYLDENKNFVFINKSPEIELFQVESNNVRSMIV